jgi:hypothetical protein
MGDDTPTDRFVIALIERIGITVEWTTRSTGRLRKGFNAAVRWAAERLSKLRGAVRP